MRVLDLFSGLGGWSEAFVKRGYEVQRIENNPLLSGVPHTQEMCVVELRDILQDYHDRGYEVQKPDVITASPPCLHFSNAFSSPKSIYQRKYGTLDGYEPPLDLVYATLDIIKLCKPRYWVIENVVGSIRYLEPILGKPRQIIGPYVLWGNYPLLDDNMTLPSKADKDKRWSKIRANHKAYIPFKLSHALMIAILSQQTVYDWLQ